MTNQEYDGVEGGSANARNGENAGPVQGLRARLPSSKLVYSPVYPALTVNCCLHLNLHRHGFPSRRAAPRHLLVLQDKKRAELPGERAVSGTCIHKTMFAGGGDPISL